MLEWIIRYLLTQQTQGNIMNKLLKVILASTLFFSVSAPVSAMDYSESAGMEEVKKKKKKGKKIGGAKGKKSKKGFFSKIFGSK